MIKTFLALPLSLFTMSVAHGIDSYSAEVGAGDETRIANIAAQRSWLTENNLDSYWEVSVADIVQRKYQD